MDCEYEEEEEMECTEENDCFQPDPYEYDYEEEAAIAALDDEEECIEEQEEEEECDEYSPGVAGYDASVDRCRDDNGRFTTC
ncbi:hypothetical protein PBPMD00_23 [Pinkberry virus LS07-2018-MD00]|jgi:hypothetical protein|nr:hypothetical protein PBPMD00_23 [Pinkberry virus LS07-2018-MD00]